MTARRVDAALCLTLLGLVVLFFAKPLLLPNYIFPWDFRYVQVPLITFLADQLHTGRFPLWDPYTYCGNPIYANIQACFFHPLILLAALLSNCIGPNSLPRCLEWAVLLQMWIGGCAAYALVRHLGMSRAAAWAVGAMFETGPYFASRAEHIGALMAVAWMPLAWLAVLKLGKSVRRPWFFALAGSLAMAILGGLPAVTLAVFVSTTLLAILLSAFRLARPTLIFWTLLGCAAAIGIAAMQFFPTAQLTELSVAKYRLDWLGTGGGLCWQSLVSLVLPNHYRIFDLKQFHGPGDPSFLYLYSSLLGLSFALAALIWKRDRWTYLFASLGAIGVFWMLGDSTALWRAFYPLVPPFVLIAVHPEYSYCIFATVLAILAGFGLDRFVRRARLRWILAVTIAFDLYLVGSGRPMNTVSLRDEPGLTREALDGSRELLSGVRAASNSEFPPARVDTMNASIDWAECAPLTQVPTGSGVSPFAPERVIQVRLGLHDGGRSGWYYPVAYPASPMTDLMSERFLLVGNSAPPVLPPKWRKVANLPGNNLYEDDSAPPRAYLVPEIRGGDITGGLSFLRSNDSNLRQIAWVEGLPSKRFSTGPWGEVQIVSYGPDELVLDVRSPSAAYLVTNETWYPGWETTVDGKPQALYITNIAFRGLPIEAGTHVIRMRFRPRILPLSLAFSFSSIALLVAFCFTRGAQAA